MFDDRNLSLSSFQQWLVVVVVGQKPKEIRNEKPFISFRVGGNLFKRGTDIRLAAVVQLSLPSCVYCLRAGSY